MIELLNILDLYEITKLFAILHSLTTRTNFPSEGSSRRGKELESWQRKRKFKKEKEGEKERDSVSHF